VGRAEMQERKRKWRPMRPKYLNGALAKYASLVGSASDGAVTLPIF
jgi:dihydroxy-acid dehydratase